MKCKNCGREVVKSERPNTHIGGYRHKDIPEWNCTGSLGNYTKQTCEPELFEVYLKQIENEYPTS